MKELKLSLLYSVCLLAIQTLAGQAQTFPDTMRGSAFEPVMVTAQFLPTDSRQIMSAVRVITQEDFERKSATSLQELLLTEGNIRLQQDPILGSAIRINGLLGENVKVLVDGVPVTGRLNGNVDAAQLPLHAVRQIEIMEGAQSLFYGSDASAGIINLVTDKSLVKKTEATLNLSHEQNGFTTAAATIGQKAGDFTFQISGQYQDFNPKPDSTGSRDQLWNPKEQRSARGVVRYHPSEAFDLRLTGSLLDETITNPGEIRRPQFKPYAFDEHYLTDRSDITLHAEGTTPQHLFWQGTASRNFFNRIKQSFRYDVEPDSLSLIDGEQDTSVATGWLLRANLASQHPTRMFNFLGGIEYYLEEAEGSRILDTTLSRNGYATSADLSAFASGNVRIHSTMSLQGGVRWTHNAQFGDAVNPSLWWKWSPAPAWQIKASYANGFRAPDLKEIYFHFVDINHDISGNPDLTPEYSDNLRAEISYTKSQSSGAHWDAGVFGFYNSIRDRIVLTQINATRYTYSNLDEWRTLGAGAQFAWHHDHWHIKATVIHTAFFNTLHVTNPETPMYNPSTDVSGEFGFSMPKQHLEWLLWYKWTGDTPYFFLEENNVREGISEDWHMLNLSLNFTPAKPITISGGVKNILDVVQIRQIDNGPAHAGDALLPIHWGRSFFASLRFRI